MQTTYKELILDGNNFLFRAYYADIRNKVEGQEKTDSVIYQFIKMLKALMERHKPEKVYFTWDKKLNYGKGQNFRNGLADYKGHREESDTKDQILAMQMPIQAILDSMGVITVYPWDLEADDVIYWLSKQAERSLVISSDKDLLQLVDEKTDVLLATKNILVNVQNFAMNANVSHKYFILFKSILGDTSDNIKGIPRFGAVNTKKAIEYFEQNNIMCRADDKEPYFDQEKWDIIENNIKLIDLGHAFDSYPEEFAHYQQQLDETTTKFDAVRLKELFSEHRLKGYLAHFSEFTNLFDKNPLTVDEFDLDFILEQNGI
jgi:5'-3' exonuclease